MDCVSITTVLAHGLPFEELRGLVAEHSCQDCTVALENAAWVLHVAHQTCHKENAFSRRIEGLLNTRFRKEIAAIRAESCLAVARRLAEQRLLGQRMIATQWALLTDPDHEKQQVGHHLAHALLLRSAEAKPLEPRSHPHHMAACAPRDAALQASNN
jgi:hypothetical protein